MRVIVAGSRWVQDGATVDRAIRESGFDVTEVVSGGARGVDLIGERWAAWQGLPVHRFHAKWGSLGRAAGPVRNREMAAYAEALVAVWDGESRGTANMIEEAKTRGIPVHVHRVSSP